MSRRAPRHSGPYPPLPPSKCAKVLYYTWRLCSVVFAHLVMISLVVAYCILGAVAFERLEAQHEREVKQNISFIRQNTTHAIWSMTNTTPVLVQGNWTTDVTHMLKDFENAILLEMKVRGWDGNESTEHIQWTFTGALFYSIIVITTIGYGHIAPKTQTGKVVTILYAILGIPLMLLCLSNIGDVMASSFRFLYWRVCCYVCTRPPQRHHRHHQHQNRAIRRSLRGSRRRRAPPLQRAHSDTGCRYRDSGYGSGRGRSRGRGSARTRSQPPPLADHNQHRSWDRGSRECAGEPAAARQERHSRSRHHYDDVHDEFPKVSLPLDDLEIALQELAEHQKKHELRSKSLPRPSRALDTPGYGEEFAWPDGQDTRDTHDLHDVDYHNYTERRAREIERGRDGGRLRDTGEEADDEHFEHMGWAGDGDRHRYCSGPPNQSRDMDHRDEWRGRRARSAYEYGTGWRDHGRDYGTERWRDHCETEEYGTRWRDHRRDHGPEQYGPRWRDQGPEEYGARWRDHGTDEDSQWEEPEERYTVDNGIRYAPRYTPSPDPEEWSDEVFQPVSVWSAHRGDGYTGPDKEELKPVPIWLCALLVGGYIVAGTFMFRRWEGWSALDAAYFCFITLTTIGFGDFVPAQGVGVEERAGAGSGGSPAAAAAVHSLALCALYILLGIALLAMAFNLVQEQVRAHVARMATALGIIKRKQQRRY